MKIWVISTAQGIVESAFFSQHNAENWIRVESMVRTYPPLFRIAEVEMGDRLEIDMLIPEGSLE